jgi:hypothetical protein
VDSKLSLRNPAIGSARRKMAEGVLVSTSRSFFERNAGDMGLSAAGVDCPREMRVGEARLVGKALQKCGETKKAQETAAVSLVPVLNRTEMTKRAIRNRLVSAGLPSYRRLYPVRLETTRRYISICNR